MSGKAFGNGSNQFGGTGASDDKSAGALSLPVYRHSYGSKELRQQLGLIDRNFVRIQSKKQIGILRKALKITLFFKVNNLPVLWECLKKRRFPALPGTNQGNAGEKRT